MEGNPMYLDLGHKGQINFFFKVAFLRHMRPLFFLEQPKDAQSEFFKLLEINIEKKVSKV